MQVLLQILTLVSRMRAAGPVRMRMSSSIAPTRTGLGTLLACGTGSTSASTECKRRRGLCAILALIVLDAAVWAGLVQSCGIQCSPCSTDLRSLSLMVWAVWKPAGASVSTLCLFTPSHPSLCPWEAAARLCNGSNHIFHTLGDSTMSRAIEHCHCPRQRRAACYGLSESACAATVLHRHSQPWGCASGRVHCCVRCMTLVCPGGRDYRARVCMVAGPCCCKAADWGCTLALGETRGAPGPCQCKPRMGWLTGASPKATWEIRVETTVKICLVSLMMGLRLNDRSTDVFFVERAL